MRRRMVSAGFVLLLCIALFIASGFQKRTDVVLVDFTAAGDSIELRTSLMGSMGYIRDIDVSVVDDRLYASFHTAFGGFNSSIGAKNSFLITVPPDCREILFDRGSGSYSLVLLREDDGTWGFPPLG